MAEMKKTLGLTGVTMNAMALIAPGAFLWLTFQVQSAQVDLGGTTTAMDMFAGLVAALILAFLTAISYSKLSELYPEAGTGSSYYFTEQAVLNENRLSHLARLSKFVVGWFSHLYYWVYPGVMVAMMATLIAYIFSQFGIDLSPFLAGGDGGAVRFPGGIHRVPRHTGIDDVQYSHKRHPDHLPCCSHSPGAGVQVQEPGERDVRSSRSVIYCTASQPQECYVPGDDRNPSAGRL